ncbi:MAG: hypothetical protein Q4G33_02425 [bacterium]|nr:hypothetical protein [bacterium]
MEILNMMEDTIDKASSVPLTGKIMLDKDELMDYIQEIRLVYPEELKEAKWVKSERARILSEAEARAETIQKNAAETQMQLINEHEIYRCAEEQANEMIEQVRQEAMDTKQNADEYVLERIERLEESISLILQKVRDDKASFQNS